MSNVTCMRVTAGQVNVSADLQTLHLLEWSFFGRRTTSLIAAFTSDLLDRNLVLKLCISKNAASTLEGPRRQSKSSDTDARVNIVDPVLSAERKW